DVDAAAHRLAGRDRHDGAAVGGGDLGADLLAPGIVDADHRGVALALVGQDAALGGDIALHRAVPLQVVGRQVQDNGDVGVQAGGQVELVGAHLQDVDRAAVHVGQV